VVIVVLADTHIRRSSMRRLPDAVYRALEDADLVLHAGDVLVPELLDELREFAPVHAVLGNNDVAALAAVLPDRLTLDVEGVQVAMVHDSGARAGRPNRMRRWFPEADIVVFGHSHIPMAEEGVGGQLLFNPGSPTERRRQPVHTYGEIDVRDGAIVRADIVEVR
jgi:putative phosphoesterase